VPSPVPRFTDNGNGTVRDNLTGLIWLKQVNCFGFQTWQNALNAANGLAHGNCGLADGSVAGDWRLPNIKELQSLIDFGQVDPALPPGHPFSDVLFTGVWSSTTYSIAPDNAWLVSLHVGVSEGGARVFGTALVWPVQGGL
jgi:hypothetical protein